jgi:CheY-like chemotaxis protein
MVKLLAELHGGAVAVESVVGEGSCFTIWLPLRTAADVLPKIAGPYSSARPDFLPGARTALVVEDDLKSAELIRVQLEAEGFQVLHAASAEGALTLALQQPLALITLDIMLPNMDGWEFLGLLKEHTALRRIPVVIISIVAERNKGFALGAAAVIEKPISRQELYESLVDIGLFPVNPGTTSRVLIVDAARVRRERGNRDGASGAAGSHRARPDDARGERLRCRRRAQRAGGHGANSDSGRDGQANHSG